MKILKLLNFYEIMFLCILSILIIYHIYKREYKKIYSLLVVIILSFLSIFLTTVFQIQLDNFSNLVYLFFLLMSLYLGGTQKFYDRYKWWDRTIHFLSGIAFVGFGVAIARTYTSIEKFGILFFSFTFSMTLHIFWEVLEYLSDCISHENAQRWQKIHDSNNHVSKNVLQPAGLVDTMNDIICCLIGSVFAAIIWWFVI